MRTPSFRYRYNDESKHNTGQPIGLDPGNTKGITKCTNFRTGNTTLHNNNTGQPIGLYLAKTNGIMLINTGHDHETWQ